MPSRASCIGWLQRHPGSTLALMTLAFLVSGALSIDLVRLLHANLGFLSEHGWQAVQDEGLWQLVGLLARAGGATLGWLFFKLCEQLLLQRLMRQD